MTRDRATDAVRRLARVRDEQVAAVAGAEAREGLLEGIVAMPLPSAPAPRRRRRAGVVAGGVAVAFAASATIGWAIVRTSPRDTTALQCQINDSPSIIDAVSGDPVADCAEEWQRQTGSVAPPMRAYDNGHGGVLVQPAADPAPAGSRPLAPGGQNLALIQLEESLADNVAGLGSRCFAEAEAVAFARAELARLGLADWVVEPRGNPGATCYDAGVAVPATRSVTLLAVPAPPPAGATHMRLARRLREIARECLPLETARERVEAAARDVGLSSDPAFPQYRVTAVPTDAKCTAIRQRVGGSIFVTLRGPAR